MRIFFLGLVLMASSGAHASMAATLADLACYPKQLINSNHKICKELAALDFEQAVHDYGGIIYRDVHFKKKNDKRTRGIFQFVIVSGVDTSEIVAVAKVIAAGEKNLKHAKHVIDKKVNKFFAYCLESKCDYVEEGKSEKLHLRIPNRGRDLAVIHLSYKDSGQGMLELSATHLAVDYFRFAFGGH